MSSLEGSAAGFATPSRFLDSALYYAARGWRVVPVYAPVTRGCSCGDLGCSKHGKHPRIRGWQRRATSDAAQLTEWWHQRPEANVGVVTGRASGIVVVDVDPRNGGEDTLHALERQHGKLPRTPSVKSGGGGSHYYFQAPAALRATTLDDGVDLLGENSLVIAPPSLHASDRAYEWDQHPAEVELAALPDWILRRATPARSARLITKGVIPEGERNASLAQIAGRLRLLLPQAEGIPPALQAINEQRCRPPLSRNEVEQIARSAGRWHALPWLTSPREFFADERLSGIARLLLRVLCDHADSEGICWPSHDTLIRLTGIKSSTTISKAIAELEDAGRITVQRRPRHANVYRVSRSLAQLYIPSDDHPLVLPFQDLEAE